MYCYTVGLREESDKEISRTDWQKKKNDGENLHSFLGVGRVFTLCDHGHS
jgi:hypothetical protein